MTSLLSASTVREEAYFSFFMEDIVFHGSMLYMGYSITVLWPFADTLCFVFTEALESGPEPLVPVIEVESSVGSVLHSGLDFSVYLAHGDFLFFFSA